RLARRIGIRHLVIQTDEFSNPDYARNPANRCYYCKSELYERMERLRPELGVAVIVNGANTDDQGDWRPGTQAANEYRVRSPLIEAGLNKAEVRQLARHWDLPTWDKPAMPCLSSRVAYGLEVTPERMRQIEAAERFLRQRGFRDLRVRYPQPETARIEVPVSDIGRLVEPRFRAELVQYFKSLGFKSISVDLEGLRSGSMNTFLPADALQLARPLADS
ncbi:MAG: ATP-dependent sacrificial sulfur transferase LarE, partial [Gemmatimonadales bacterium]